MFEILLAIHFIVVSTDCNHEYAHENLSAQRRAMRGHGKTHRLGSITMQLFRFVQVLFFVLGGATPTLKVLPLKPQDFADKCAGSFVTVKSRLVL